MHGGVRTCVCWVSKGQAGLRLLEFQDWGGQHCVVADHIVSRAILSRFESWLLRILAM